MARKIKKDVHWINECYQTMQKQLHVSVYLVECDDGYVLVDTGSFNDRGVIKKQVDEITGEDKLTAAIVSHADLPHSGNAEYFLDEYNDIELIASSKSPEIVGLPSSATTCEVGGSLTIAGRDFSFLSPPLSDLQHSMWIYDEENEMLFSGDGFGNYHTNGQQNLLYSEMRSTLTAQQIAAFHQDHLRWMKYVEPKSLRADLEPILLDKGTDYIAPIHGNPIEGEYIKEYLELFMDAATKISDQYNPDINDVTDKSGRGNSL